MAVEYKGGACEICGYNKCEIALVFHHLNPTQKDFALSMGGYTRSWEKVKKELDKCTLLCSNCHAETHANLVNSIKRSRVQTFRGGAAVAQGTVKKAAFGGNVV